MQNKLNSKNSYSIQLENPTKIQEEITLNAQKINSILKSTKYQIFNYLEKIEKYEPWFKYNKYTLNYLFEKYPNITLEEFSSIFLNNTYNKVILMCDKEIFTILDLNNINPWDDLIEHIMDKISLTNDELNNKIAWKIDFLTFPNLSTLDTAQSYFYEKMTKLLPNTKIIFGDQKEIKSKFWQNQLDCDSVWFIDLLWNWNFNTCLLKILKTNPNDQKLDELNKLFENIDKDIFIWWSTTAIPFNLPGRLYSIIMPKIPNNWNKKLNLLENWLLINSMWYLNSAYYTQKVVAAFVSWSHNIWEPLNAWKLTVVNNEIENRFNHNWLISYFWEKVWLLHYTIWNEVQIQKEVDEFLNIPREEINKRNDEFQKMYKEKIENFINWLLYLFLKKSFKEKIN